MWADKIYSIKFNFWKPDFHVPEDGEKIGMSCSVCQVVFESVEIQVTNVDGLLNHGSVRPGRNYLLNV